MTAHVRRGGPAEAWNAVANCADAYDRAFKLSRPNCKVFHADGLGPQPIPVKVRIA